MEKYVPSGYQIIDIHINDLFTEKVSYSRGENADVDQLLDYFINGNNKPLLLTITDGDKNMVSGYFSTYVSSDKSECVCSIVKGIGDKYIDVVCVTVDLTANEVNIALQELSVGQ